MNARSGPVTEKRYFIVMTARNHTPLAVFESLDAATAKAAQLMAHNVISRFIDGDGAYYIAVVRD